MNKTSPLYLIVYERILHAIQSGDYQVGEQLPTENRLAEELGVSLITVRRAMQELANEGLVERKAGKGTFVAQDTRIEQAVSALTSFTADMKKNGIAPSSTILKQGVVEATKDRAQRLHIEPGEKLFHLMRVREGNGIPLLVESVYISLEICRDLLSADYSTESLYQVLSKNGIRLVRSRQEFEPILLNKEQAEWLQVKAQTPAFMRKAISFSQERPIEWVESIYRKDQFRFVVETGSYQPELVLRGNNS